MFGFNKTSYNSIIADDAKTRLDQDNNIILLDVRTKQEHNEIHIPKSVLIPLNEIKSRALNELQDKNAEIIVYCRSGARSSSASSILSNLGYTNVYNLIGGISGWKYETK